jgi:dynein heavy chain, axonemal
LPKLKAAENALLVLDKNSITELKAMSNPPIAVRMTLQAMCLIIDPNPKERIKNEKTLKMETDWWAASVRNLTNPKLLSDLVNFNTESIADGVINNLGKFLNDPNNKDILTVQNVANSSQACECIIQWIYGVYNFYFVNKKVKPKKESLKIADQKVNSLNKKLDSKRAELDAANRKVEDLNYEL